MNLLYLSLTNLDKKILSGVNKKIKGQVKAFRKQGINTYRIALKNTGLYAFHGEEETLLKKSYMHNKYEFFEKRIRYYTKILEFIKCNKIMTIYIRYPLSDPFFIAFLKKCKKEHVKIFMEIATFPYDKELSSGTLLVDKFYRKRLHKYVDHIITFSEHDTIYGVETINIGNGIDVEEINPVRYCKGVLETNLVGLASLTIFQGFDRLINGMGDYYKENKREKVFFHVVGVGPELSNLKLLTKELKLEKYVIFHGYKNGRDLDRIFEKCDIGVGTLGMYRKNLKAGYVLKLREYCARGLPFILAYEDKDFVDFKYAMKVSNDSTPIDIETMLMFLESIKEKEYTEEIVEYAKKMLTWDAKIKLVVQKIVS